MVVGSSANLHNSQQAISMTYHWEITKLSACKASLSPIAMNRAWNRSRSRKTALLAFFRRRGKTGSTAW